MSTAAMESFPVILKAYKAKLAELAELDEGLPTAKNPTAQSRTRSKRGMPRESKPNAKKAKAATALKAKRKVPPKAKKRATKKVKAETKPKPKPKPKMKVKAEVRGGRNEQIKTLIEAGWAPSAVANVVGLSATGVRSVCRRNGFAKLAVASPPPPPPVVAAPANDKAAEAVKAAEKQELHDLRLKLKAQEQALAYYQAAPPPPQTPLQWGQTVWPSLCCPRAGRD